MAVNLIHALIVPGRKKIWPKLSLRLASYCLRFLRTSRGAGGFSPLLFAAVLGFLAEMASFPPSSWNLL